MKKGKRGRLSGLPAVTVSLAFSELRDSFLHVYACAAL